MNSYSNKIGTIPNVDFLDNIFEVDSKYLVLSDSAIVYSANKEGNFQLFKYDDGLTSKLTNFQESVFSPFIFENKIYGLSDSSGNEKYFLLPSDLDSLHSKQKIKKLYSSHHGNYLIIQFRNDPTLYLFDSQTKNQKEIVKIESKLNGIFFLMKRIS
ncbi:MAG: hypothetical protein GY936_13125 [Ignavibacteriae bacterium]|nr:hypothetical protein [Ignavibacteriota bacterium]